MKPSDLSSFSADTFSGESRKETPWLSNPSKGRLESIKSSRPMNPPVLGRKRIASDEEQEDEESSYVSSDDSEDDGRRRKRKSKPKIKNPEGARRSSRVIETGRKKYEEVSSDESEVESVPRRRLRKAGKSIESSEPESDTAAILRAAQSRNGGLSSEDESMLGKSAGPVSKKVIDEDEEDMSYNSSDSSVKIQDDPTEVPEEPREIVEKILARRKTKQYEFLVKFRCRSYMHCRWEGSSFFFDSESDFRATKLKNFQSKAPNGDTPQAFDGGYFFNPIFLNIERILATRWQADEEVSSESFYPWVLVKWEGLPYSESTWEKADSLDLGSLREEISRFVKVNSEQRLGLRRAAPVRQRVRGVTGSEASEAFVNRLVLVGGGEEADTAKRVYEYGNRNSGPALTLFEFQKEGVSWLLFNWLQGRGSVLADEMGLGKTVQTVVTLQEMSRYCRSNRGTCGEALFLIVAPLSVLNQWAREISKWTDLEAVIYHGSARDRGIIGRYEWQGVLGSEGNQWETATSQATDQVPSIDNVNNLGPWMPSFKRTDGHPKFDVCITSYEMLASEAETFSSFLWTCIVLDESHKLKGTETKNRQMVTSIPCKHRLLLTGTPIQNNLGELWSLLNLCSASSWPDKDSFLQEFGQLKSAQDTENLQRRIQPFLLQRKKAEVMAHLMPAKEETVVSVELTRVQRETYKAVFERNLGALLAPQGKGNAVPPSQMNIHMELRKTCNHPFLIQGVEDKILSGTTLYSSEGMARLVASSGKMVFLDKLLGKLEKEGEKLLIFSQFTMMLDLIEDYLRWKGYIFERLDGAVNARSRQEAVDRFNKTPSGTATPSELVSPFVFLLSTKAGGVGLNLTAAAYVLLFDQDYNPQNDLQAQARSHRIGQTKQVKIFRLVTRGTYEEHMFRVASQKLGLEQAVMSNVGGKKDQKLSKEDMDRLLKEGAYALLEDDEGREKGFVEAGIDDILKTRSTKVDSEAASSNTAASALGNGFSKAFFAVNEQGEELSTSDPDFWTKIAKAGGLNAKEEKKSKKDDLLVEGPRRRLVKGAVPDEDLNDDYVSDSSQKEAKKSKQTVSIESRRMNFIASVIGSFGVWGYDGHQSPTIEFDMSAESYRGRLQDLLAEKWEKKFSKQLNQVNSLETGIEIDVLFYMAGLYRFLSASCDDEAALQECARSLAMTRMHNEAIRLGYCSSTPVQVHHDYQLSPIAKFDGSTFFAGLDIPDYVIEAVPRTFQAARAQLMEIELVEQVKAGYLSGKPLHVVEAKPSRMQPEWWCADDDRELLRCALVNGVSDCSAKITSDPYFEPKLKNYKFNKQFVLYRIDKLIPKWWSSRARLMTDVLLSHGMPAPLVNRTFKATGYPWLKKFAQSDVLLSRLANLDSVHIDGPQKPFKPLSETDESLAWKALHAKLPRGFPLSQGDFVDYAKALLYKVLLLLGMKNETTHAAVRQALKVSKVNEELDVKVGDSSEDSQQFVWPLKLSRDEAFCMLWRWQTMHTLKSEHAKDLEGISHLLSPLSVSTASALLSQCAENGLDSWSRDGELKLKHAVRVAAELSQKIHDSPVKDTKRSATEGSSPSAKKPKGNTKQKSLMDFMTKSYTEKTDPIEQVVDEDNQEDTVDLISS